MASPVAKFSLSQFLWPWDNYEWNFSPGSCRLVDPICCAGTGRLIRLASDPIVLVNMSWLLWMSEILCGAHHSVCCLLYRKGELDGNILLNWVTWLCGLASGKDLITYWQKRGWFACENFLLAVSVMQVWILARVRNVCCRHQLQGCLHVPGYT